MELNTAIWGTPEQQTGQISNISTTYGVFKSSLSMCDTLKHYAENIGKSELIDESVNYWQLSDDSMFNHYVFIRRDGSNNHIYETVKNVKPKSIFLVMRPPVGNNLNFDVSNTSCPIWSNSVSSNLPYNNYGDIITTFNYNGICARYILNCFKKDSDGNPTGSVTNFSVYDYFNSDENGTPIKDQYIIIAITSDIFAVQSNGSNAFNVNHVFYPVSSTPVETPQPNYYYTNSDYTVYNRPNNLCGHNALSSNNGYGSQQGAFGQNGNAAWYCYDPKFWEIRNFLNASNQYIEYFAFTGSYEDMLRQLSTLGFWFKEDLTSGSTISPLIILGENCTDNHCIMPEIIAGRTTGNYKRGTAAAADPQAAWGSDWRDNVNYRGDDPYRSSGDTGDLTSVFHRLSLGGSLTYYVGTPYAMDSLIGIINSGYQPANNDQFVLDFKGTNPADYVCTVMYYPQEFQCPYTAGTFTTIHIGAISPTFPPNLLAQADFEAGYYKEFSHIDILPHFSDFRDYAPYTTMSLYVPFCGTVDLDPALFIGHTLTVRLFIDYLTGNCTAAIMRDDTVVDTVSGSCGVSIPLTALNTGNYQNAIKSAEIALKQAEINRKTAWLGAMGALGTTIGGAAMGNPMALGAGVAGAMGVVTAIQQTTLTKELAEYNLDHIAPAVCNVSAASPCNALGLDYDIHLLIKRCKEIEGYNESAYGQTVGHACCINDVLGNYSGLTVCSNVRLDSVVSDSVTIDNVVYGSNAATADEIALIRQALSDGVYM